MAGRRESERCTRPLEHQWCDRSGSIRRIDHPPGAVARLDLLDDEALDAYRARHSMRAVEALDAVEALAEAMDIRLAATEAATRATLEDRTDGRPILSVVTCSTCGAYAIVRAARPWPVDRAMRRTGLAERDVRAVLVLLLEAGCDGDLDRLSTEQLHELHGLVGEDLDLETLRARYDDTVEFARDAGYDVDRHGKSTPFRG